MEPEELMAYLDGELSVDQAARTAAQLQECRECLAFAAELKSVAESLTAWDVEQKEPQLTPASLRPWKSGNGIRRRAPPGDGGIGLDFGAYVGLRPG